MAWPLRNLVSVALALVILAAAAAAEAQRPVKIPRVGYLILSPLAMTPSPERQAFLDELRALGYVEGQNLRIEYKAANWNRELLADLAEELVEAKVDVIVAVEGTTDAALGATKTIPIVLVAVTDPEESGLVRSLARPGGNVTGPAWSSKGLLSKQLQLLKEAVPRASRVAFLWSRVSGASERGVQELESAAKAMGVELLSLQVTEPKEFPEVFARLERDRPDALMATSAVLITAYRPLIVEFATKHRLPTMFERRAEVEAGGLMAYAQDVHEIFRRAAHYVDKILKGARPGELPMERVARFELIINLRTARALALKLPPALLSRADHLLD
jgi:putative ABC transport system substrate-binding protein